MKNQRIRDSHDTEDSDVKPPLAARVTTLQEAVQISLANGYKSDCLFVFVRALKALEATVQIKLPPKELQNAFSLWWSVAKAQLPHDADFDEYRFTFELAFERVRAALGANPLEEAIRRAKQASIPPEAKRYSSVKIRDLVAVCHQLQILAGESPFFLSARCAARIAGITNPTKANMFLEGLVRDGILTITTKGIPGGAVATRYRFNFTQQP